MPRYVAGCRFEETPPSHNSSDGRIYPPARDKTQTAWSCRPILRSAPQSTTDRNFIISINVCQYSHLSLEAIFQLLLFGLRTRVFAENVIRFTANSGFNSNRRTAKQRSPI